MKKIIIIAMALFVASCERGPTPFVAAPFAFETQHDTIRVNVHEIRVIQQYQSPLKRPYVEQEFPVTPAAAIEKWVKQRLSSNPSISANSVLEITIEDASVREVKLPKTKGFKGLITDDQDARYDAKMNVSFRLYSGGAGLSQASAQVTISRSRTINERATVYQREAIYHQMTAEMMKDFERETHARLRQYFSQYLN